MAWMVDRAVYAFAMAIEQDQEIAVGRLPTNAKEATRQHVRNRVLDAYLGLDTATTPGRFRDPAARKG